MKCPAYLLISLLPLAIVGCGSGSSSADEAKLHQELGGPPTINHGAHHPGAANKSKAAEATAGQSPANGAAGGAPASGQ